ncbi:hypothetical protein AUJ46_00635 [Candidatus Peregrinibacteria bacterium CG1_02_54_53]|nr:MAG: hypothetical protein AUJ46_00635 [Candidatus Peregrinibacteria bacterium CG1_02_54_53]
MKTILPIITVSELQRNTKKALASVKEYAVIQSHGKDVAIVLCPQLGHVLLKSDSLRGLLATVPDDETISAKLDHMIGNVIHELSKR